MQIKMLAPQWDYWMKSAMHALLLLLANYIIDLSNLICLSGLAIMLLLLSIPSFMRKRSLVYLSKVEHCAIIST